MTLDVAELARAVRMSLLYPGFCFEWTPATGDFKITPPPDVQDDLDLLADNHPFTRQLRPCGTHAAYARHKARDEEIDDQCRRAERRYQRDLKRARTQRRSADLSAPVPVNSRCTPPARSDREAPAISTGLSSDFILCSPTGVPLLISVAGQRESGAQGTAEGPVSRRGETVPGTPDADAVTESEAS